MSKINIIPLLSLLKLDKQITGDLTKNEIVNCISEATNINLLDEKYLGKSDSAYNRLIAFAKKEEDNTVYLAMNRVLEAWIKKKEEKNKIHYNNLFDVDCDIFTESEKEKLIQCKSELDKIKPSNINLTERLNIISVKDDYTIKKLKDDIQKYISAGEYDALMDRLHTFLMHIFTDKCKNTDLTVGEKETLNSIAGKYIKTLKSSVDGTTFVILHSIIEIFEKFNTTRNWKTFAHAHALIAKKEAELIANYIIFTLEFIDSIEKNYEKK
jgi:hypothetical protein